MASFEQRSGSVRVVVRVDGKKRTATFDTMGEARAWAAQAERLKSVGQLRAGAAAQATNRQLFELYLDAVAGGTDSAKWNTLRIMKWLDDPLAAYRVSDTVTHDINGWIARRSTEVSGATVNRELNLMSGAFRYAVQSLRWITVNPCHGAARPPRGKPRSPALLTEAQVEAVKIASGYAHDPELRTLTARVGAAWLLSLETGMRSGELLRLRPEHYDRARRVATVAAQERGGRKGAKSGRATVDPSRRVPLTARAVDLLDQLLASMPAGQPYIIGVDDAQRDALWRKARDKAGLDGFTFHDAKHEAATRLAPHIDVLALSHALGTKDVRLLRDTYYNSDAAETAKLLPESLRVP